MIFVSTSVSSEELFHLYLERMENDYNSSEYPGNLVEEVSNLKTLCFAPSDNYILINVFCQQ